MKESDRKSAGEMALLCPLSIQIGGYQARKFSGGDMLVCSRLGLKLASGDPEVIKPMTLMDQTGELMQIGALLCHPIEKVSSALWQSEQVVRDQLIGPVLFSLNPAETSELIAWVAGFFTQADALQYSVEPKPDAEDPNKAQPEGK